VRARDYRRDVGEKCDAIGNRTPSRILGFERRAAPPEPRRNASTTALDPRSRTRVGSREPAPPTPSGSKSRRSNPRVARPLRRLGHGTEVRGRIRWARPRHERPGAWQVS
jgi:hypothetical protein